MNYSLSLGIRVYYWLVSIITRTVKVVEPKEITSIHKVNL